MPQSGCSVLYGVNPNWSAMQGTSRNKIHQELGLKSLKSRRWYRCLSCMYKIMKEAPSYLINLIPKCENIT